MCVVPRPEARPRGPPSDGAGAVMRESHLTIVPKQRSFCLFFLSRKSRPPAGNQPGAKKGGRWKNHMNLRMVSVAVSGLALAVTVTFRFRGELKASSQVRNRPTSRSSVLWATL